MDKRALAESLCIVAVGTAAGGVTVSGAAVGGGTGGLFLARNGTWLAVCVGSTFLSVDGLLADALRCA